MWWWWWWGMRPGVGYLANDFPFWPLSGNKMWHLDLGSLIKAHKGLIYGVLLNIPPFFNFCRVSSSLEVGWKGKPRRPCDGAVGAARPRGSGADGVPGRVWVRHRAPLTLEATEPVWWGDPSAHGQTSTQLSLRGLPRAGHQGHGGLRGQLDSCPLCLASGECGHKHGPESIDTNIFRAW